MSFQFLANIKNTYQDPSSVKKITSATEMQPFSSELTNPTQVRKLLNSINTKTTTGFDEIPTKLNKLPGYISCTPLCIAINNSLKYVFPDDGNGATVASLDKGKPK